MSFLSNLPNRLTEWLTSIGADNAMAGTIRELIVLLVVLAVFLLIDRLVIHYGRSWTKKVVEKTKISWDDILYRHRVFSYLIRLLPALLMLYTIDLFFDYLDTNLLKGLASIYIVYLFVGGSIATLRSSEEIYISRREPGSIYTIKPFLQVLQIVIIVLGSLIALSILLSKNVSAIIGGMGAFAAILMLVFKDSILGFVGGLQISINNMLRYGDWITLPVYNVDGTVVDISLTTVKVQNWDKTISTIPTYSLVTESFQNWRGMKDSGGRRIKRSINIDISSIKFCTPELLEKLRNIDLLSEYVENRESEIKSYNERVQNGGAPIVRRQQTNIGIFRAYITGYLQAHELILKDMTFMVRQLQPSEHGLPVEIYVFSKIQEWTGYERLQADIFDHILATAPLFELKIFQSPSSFEMQELVMRIQP